MTMEIQEVNPKPVEKSPFVDMQEDKTRAISKKTRFQVKKIDFNLEGHDQNGTSSHEDAAEDTDRLCNDDNQASSYDTQYLKSLRNYTREPLPRAAHYRNTLTMNTHHDRPTLDELHDPSATISPDTHKVNFKFKILNFLFILMHLLYEIDSPCRAMEKKKQVTLPKPAEPLSWDGFKVFS